ncbi:MAG: zinc ABC transporter permease subunit ZnuB [Arsenophonus sp.]|nr:MAG: zinc ABC transporter permease subunit ZnuB [Arsenophonus sp.]
MIELLIPGWSAGILLTIVTGPLGTFIFWRRLSYFGDTLAHSSLLGVALSILFDINLFYTVICITLILAFLLNWLEKYQQLTLDILLGIIAHTTFSLGLLIVSIIGNVRTNLMIYLFGDLLSVTNNDILFIAIGVFLIIITVISQWNKFLLITINQDLAFVDGIKIKKLKLLLMLITALTIGISMKFVGALIITSLLILPVATARIFSKTPEQLAIISIIIGMFSVTGGLIISANYDTPTGPSIVVCTSILFIFSLLINIYKEKINLYQK